MARKRNKKVAYMELPVTNFQPLSVSRGLREPFRMVEGIPAHMRPALDSWTCSTLWGLQGDVTENLQTLANLLRFSLNARHPESFVSAVARNDDDYLDLLHELLSLQLPNADELDRVLALGGSVWRVADARDGLEARVPTEARESYSRALEVHERSAEFLSDAWRHAFGRSPDAGDAWGDAIKAVEAVLHDVVEPKNRDATLGSMKRVLRDAPPGKFIVQAPGPDALSSVRSMLEVLPYEDGRHGTDERVPTLEVARVAVLQATAIIAAMGEGMLQRA